jgi:hypothetical protein
MALIVMLAISLLGVFAIAWRRSVLTDLPDIEQARPPRHTDNRASSNGSGSRSRFPTLALLETAMDHPPGSLTRAVDAATLEQRAATLVSDYLSETSLLTGLVPRRVFDRIVTELLHGQRLAPEPIVSADLSMAQAAETAVDIAA